MKRAGPLASLVLAACTGGGAEAPVCAAPERTGVLPAEVRESSGAAASRRHPGILWTHNDSDADPVLYAIDAAGQVHGAVRVTGARNRDWEDLALGPCPAGDCLYIADTGDNLGSWKEATVYRVAEPEPGAAATAPAERFPIRYPDRPIDVEAIYVRDETLFLVSKGRDAPVLLFRYPGALRADTTVEVEAIQRLGPDPAPLAFQVTGASAAPDGWVAVRTYTAVQLYRARSDGRLAPALEAPGIDLQSLQEPQGEGVALAVDGTIWLTSEAGEPGLPGVVGRVRCRF